MPSLFEIGPVVLEKKIFQILKFVNVFLQYHYLPLEKGWGLHLNNLESPSAKNALFPIWLKLAQQFWRIRWKCEEFTTTMTTTTDNGQILIRKAHLSLRLRWAKNETFNWEFNGTLCTWAKIPAEQHWNKILFQNWQRHARGGIYLFLASHVPLESKLIFMFQPKGINHTSKTQQNGLQEELGAYLPVFLCNFFTT